MDLVRGAASSSRPYLQVLVAVLNEGSSRGANRGGAFGDSENAKNVLPYQLLKALGFGKVRPRLPRPSDMDLT